MNSFANSLFSLLFGWARGLIQQVWVSAASGRYSGFFIWLGDHWVFLAVFLCLCGTVLDFTIWMVRWRPYLVWRTALHRVARRFQGDQTENSRRFERGYQGGVALDIPPNTEQQIEQNDWEEQAVSESQDHRQAPANMNTFTQAVVGQEPQQPWYTAEESYAQEKNDSQERDRWQRRFAPPDGYEAPSMTASPRVNSAYSGDSFNIKRRRRTEKYERRRPEWREKLIKGNEDEYAMLDGLPPAVDRQQAFHEPVYPQESGAYSAWQRPQTSANQTNGNHA